MIYLPQQRKLHQHREGQHSPLHKTTLLMKVEEMDKYEGNIEVSKESSVRIKDDADIKEGTSVH